MINTFLKTSLLLLLMVSCCTSLHAQGELARLVEISTNYYPELRARGFELEAARRQVQYERSDRLPTLDGSYQMIYSTNNNITGMFLPNLVLPISGPPVLENSFDMVFGSAASLLMNWTPITFGKRASRIQTATYRQALAQQEQALTLLEHQVRFIEAYLNYWAAVALAEAAEKNKERYADNRNLSRVLVENGLRPAVDSAQFHALYARSAISFLQAQSHVAASRARVRELLGDDAQAIGIDSALFRVLGKQAELSTVNHPLLQRSRTQTQLAQSLQTELNRSLLPDLNFWATAFARGSSILFEGGFDSPTDGLAFSKYNYGMGFQVVLPLLQFSRTSKLMQRQKAMISAAEAYELQVERALEKDRTVAVATLSHAVEAASIAPAYVEAAEYSFRALQANYDAGLLHANELIQGQADLAKAEADYIEMKVEMWKALLYFAAVRGDVTVFLSSLQE
ncbi:MAG: TolC family protein [Nitritalea sp.]